MAYKRQRNIFTYLLNSTRGISGNELSKVFRVSSRTIRSDIKYLNEILSKYNIFIESSRQKGYFIPEEVKYIATSMEKKIFEEEDLEEIPNTPSDRLSFIVSKLVFMKDYITMEELSRILFVSKTTIYLDIKKVIEIVDRFPQLKLEVSPIKGLRLIGEERIKRALISNILKKKRINGGSILGKGLHYMFRYDNSDLDKDILFLYETIMNSLNKYGYILTDEDISLFVKEVFIGIKRIEKGFYLDELTKGNLNLSIVRDFKREIEEYFNILIEDVELEYLQQCLNQERLLNLIDRNHMLEKDSEEIISKFLKSIKDKYSIDLMKNQIFKENLRLHLNPMLERLKANYFEENPLKNQIKANYPLAFEISLLIVPIIKEELNIMVNESEVSYIALHVAVALEEVYSKTNIAIVCGSGLGTARLIKSKIQSTYNEQINIIGYYPVYKLNDLIKGRYGKIDLIITTIPIEDNKTIPIIQVNPLINEEDLMKIKKFLDNPPIIIKEGIVKKIEEDVFKEKLFKYFDKDITYLNAILELVKLLKREDYIGEIDEFFHSVMERETLYSTILDEKVAIPHPMKSLSKTTVIPVGIFKNPIYHNGKKVEIIFLFAVNAEEDEKMKAIYSLLQEILDSKDKLNKIKVSKDFNNFIEVVKM